MFSSRNHLQTVEVIVRSGTGGLTVHLTCFRRDSPLPTATLVSIPRASPLSLPGFPVSSLPFLPLRQVDKQKVRVIIGSGMGGLIIYSDGVKALLEKGRKRITPFFIPYAITNALFAFPLRSLPSRSRAPRFPRFPRFPPPAPRDRIPQVDKQKVGVIIGSGMGGLTVYSDGVKALLEKG
ncbi:unnamed protein product, partial [Closterium sp. NIES-53]